MPSSERFLTLAVGGMLVLLWVVAGWAGWSLLGLYSDAAYYLTEIIAKGRFSAFDEVERQEAEDGATTKLLLTLSDGAKVEAVLMRSPADPRRGSGPRATICVSSQAGCAVGCPFCATGELGFTRNLSAGEIQDQVRVARQILRTEERELTNVVYMGMGEPLQNADAVFASIDGLVDPKRGGIGQRRITVYRYGPSWGSFRHSYRPSAELLGRLTPKRRQVVLPGAPPPGTPTLVSGYK